MKTQADSLRQKEKHISWNVLKVKRNPISLVYTYIAATHDTEQATELCRQLLQRISNRKNREYLLNMTTVDEFEMGIGWIGLAHARVAAIHIAAYNGNSGVVRLLCQEYGVDVNCSTSETLEKNQRKASQHWNGQQEKDIEK